MQYAYAYQLNGTQTSGLDPSAKAYINAVVAAGATVNSTQRNAINTFYKTGKVDGWYSSLKRNYLPIWGVAAANAIDMIGLTSGTFVGTVTHGAGFVQGNGTTGYFDTGTSFSAQSLTSASGTIFALVKTADSRNQGASMIGVISSANSQLIRQGTSSSIQARYTGSSQTLNGGNFRDAILIVSSTSDSSRSFRRRSSIGAASLATSAGEAAFSVRTENVTAMARGGSLVTELTNAELGAYGFGLGLSDVDSDGFTANLKTLWETCTGLALP